MSIKKLVIAAAATLAAQFAVAAPDLTGLGYVTYGDGNSYSLPIGNYYTCGSVTGKDCPYEYKGSPGANNQDPRIYIVQGAGGAQANNNSNIDDAYAAVNNELYFKMGDTAAEPNPTFTGDNTGLNGTKPLWDASLAALNSVVDLVTNQLTFFFVNNEPNSQDGLTQSLAVWARVTLTELSTNSIVRTYDLTNDTRTAAQRLAGVPAAPGYGPPPIGGGVVNGVPGLYTTENNAPQISDYLMAGGQVCIDKISKDIVNCATAAAGSFDPINHNLGENQVAYAVIFPELNAYIAGLSLANLSDYVLNVDVRYGCVTPPFSYTGTLTNGDCVQGTAVSQDNNFEQIFIAGTPDQGQEVPEPLSLLLVGTALLGLGVASKKRRV